MEQENVGGVKAVFGELGSERLPGHSIARTSGDFVLELKAWYFDNLIEVRIVNLGTEPLVAFVPNPHWSLKLVPQDGPWDYSTRSGERIVIDYAIPAFYWYPVKPGRSCDGILDLKELVEGVLNHDGWYACTLVYDDAQANRIAEIEEYDVVSEIGKVSFPPIEVHVVDGTAVEWRPLPDD